MCSPVFPRFCNKLTTQPLYTSDARPTHIDTEGGGTLYWGVRYGIRYERLASGCTLHCAHYHVPYQRLSRAFGSLIKNGNVTDSR